MPTRLQYQPWTLPTNRPHFTDRPAVQPQEYKSAGDRTPTITRHLTRVTGTLVGRLVGATVVYPVTITVTDPGSGSTNSVQVIAVTNHQAESFKLCILGANTPPIGVNATAIQVQNALAQTVTVGPGNVTVTGNSGGPWTLVFGGLLSDTVVGPITPAR